MQVLDSLISPFGIPIVAIVCFSLAGIVAAVAKQWRKVREAELEASLKSDLIRQGRSAEEIEQILKASGRVKPGCEDS